MRDLSKAEIEELESLIDDVVARYQYSSNDEQPRMKELFLAEKELSKARAMLASWEIFRSGISEQYPELLKWCPPSAEELKYHESGNKKEDVLAKPIRDPNEKMTWQEAQENVSNYYANRYKNSNPIKS